MKSNQISQIFSIFLALVLHILTTVNKIFPSASPIIITEWEGWDAKVYINIYFQERKKLRILNLTVTE